MLGEGPRWGQTFDFAYGKVAPNVDVQSNSANDGCPGQPRTIVVAVVHLEVRPTLAGAIANVAFNGKEETSTFAGG